MTQRRLALDAAVCDGHGICALIFPDRVSLDDWGYPILDPEPLESASSVKRARRAIAACPAQALRLYSVQSPPGAAVKAENGSVVTSTRSGLR